MIPLQLMNAINPLTKRQPKVKKCCLFYHYFAIIINFLALQYHIT